MEGPLEGGVGDRRTVQPERLDGESGLSLQGQLREDASDQAGELVRVARPDGDGDLGVLRQRVDHEVLVRRDRVQARLRVQLGPEKARDVPAKEVAVALDAYGIRLEGPG